MSYVFRETYNLGASYAGKTLRAQIVNDAGANDGSEITTGFRELTGGRGVFEQTYTMPDNQTGFMRVYASDAPTVFLASVALSPAEIENADVRTSLIPASTNTTMTNAHGAGSWATATGFATPSNVSDAQAAIINAIATLDDDAAAAIMAYVLESGKTLQAALLDMWATTVGDSTANDSDNPTNIAYASPDGTTQVTHTLTDTTREVA